MRRARFVLPLLLVALSGFALCLRPADALAQAACIARQLANLNNAPASLGIDLSDAQRIIVQLARANSISGPLPVPVPCNDVDKVQSWVPPPGTPGVPPGAYIAFNKDWLREVIGDNRTEVVFIFGHELGHIWRGHFDPHVHKSRVQMETEADNSGGCAVARLGGDYVTMLGLLYRIRLEEDDGYYPNQQASTATARAGFLRCGGTVDAPGPSISMKSGPTVLGASLLAETEGFQSKPSQLTTAPRTVGFGHIIPDDVWRSGHIKVYGSDIELTKDISEAQGLLLLYLDMQRVDEVLNRRLVVPLSDPQRAAVESLLFNVGTRQAEKVIGLINARRFLEVPEAFKVLNKGGGVVYPGLQRRRDREIGMWVSGS